jgi:TolA-binding protein
MKKHKRIFLIFSVVIFTLPGIKAQKTEYYTTENITFNRAVELYQNNEFGAASKLFREYININGGNNLPAQKTEEAKYYIAMSSVATKNKFALKQLTDFAAAYPESSFLPAVNFEMANILFEKHKYTQALEAFSKVSPSSLTKEERSEYFYKTGFSHLKKNQPEKALAAFKKSISYGGKYGDAASFYYAHVKYQQGQYDEALKAFGKIENNRRFAKLIPPYYMHIFYQKGDYDRVIKEGEKFYSSADRKSKPGLARIIANAYYEKGEYKNALKYFSEYEKTARHNISADEQYRIAYCKFKNGQYKAAVTNFQKAITGETQMAQNAWYYLGFCYRNSGENRFAQKAFLSAYKLKNNPEITADALFAYAKITIEKKGDPYNDAVATMQKYIASNPGQKYVNKAYNLLVQLYLSTNNYDAALKSIEKSGNPNRILRYTYQQLSYAKGIELFNRNDFTGAIKYLTASLNYPVDDELAAKALFWQADAFFRLKKYDKAALYYRKFLKSKKAYATGLTQKAYYSLSYTYFKRKEFDKAVSSFKRVLALKGLPANLKYDARLRLADSYFMLKQFDKALKFYQTVAAQNGTGADYALYQTAFCHAAKENYKKKISTLQTLVSRYKNSPYYDDALYNIATTYSALNDQRNAIVYFNKIVKEKPNSPFAKKALIKMGLVYYKNNQYDRAISTLKTAVKRYPASQEATIALNTLESIYKDKGEPGKYFSYVKTLDFVQISKSEEDSVTFGMAEEQFLEHNCSKAVTSLTRYLQNFPDGGFVLKAHYYLAECYKKNGDNQKALTHYNKVLDYPGNDYTTKALLAAARIEYDLKNYSKSNMLYKKLLERAENKSTILEAEDGVMRTAFLLENYKEAARYAEMLLKTPMVSDDQIVYAHYILAKTALKQGNKTEAMRQFHITDNLTSGELGAEAKYYLAEMSFDEGKDKEAENSVYQLSEQYPDFEYWVAKGFILLSDIYVARKNYFQARETLKSIIQNYSGDDLKEVARTKLALIPKEEDIDNNNNQ